MDRVPHPGSRTDAQLLRDAAQDPAAFAELYRRHAETVYSWLHARLAWAASDLTAETFARAWLNRRAFRDLREGSALPWLLSIARNLLADSVRRERVETRARERLGLACTLASEDGYGRVEARLSPDHALARGYRALGDQEREAVRLRVIDELPYEEVATRLAIRPAAARLRVSRALRRLARTIPPPEQP